MKAIVAVDKNWGIGKNGHLLISIPEDMNFFKKKTTNKIVVMGRKTLESFPFGLPLENRINIVLSRNKSYKIKDSIIVNSLENLFDSLKFYEQEVYVIGGGSVYKQLLPYCNTVYVTKIDCLYESDCYFPNLDKTPEWKVESITKQQMQFYPRYVFMKYIRSF